MSDHANSDSDAANPDAVKLIRQKVDSLYAQEPSAKAEMGSGLARASSRSVHQQFLYDLSRSGRSLAEIQTAWHNYYQELPDQQKHQVWQEFYAQHGQSSDHINRLRAELSKAESQPESAAVISPTDHVETKSKRPASRKRSVAEAKRAIVNHVHRSVNTKHRANIKSLLFGFSAGLLVVLILLFGFFNERFIAPFISPSRSVSGTSIISDPNNTKAASLDPKLIIPKINIEIPVVYDEPSIDEHAVQTALERGVVHYGNTPNPGELGNGVIFGHSSNNILNKGKYKFAFVLLKRLEVGDLFYLEKDGTRYTYQIYNRQIVDPTAVEVLNSQSQPASFTLITCDPPGTSLKRLVVVGQQLLPNPSTNKAPKSSPQTAKPATLPGNAPSLWSRFINWFH